MGTTLISDGLEPQTQRIFDCVSYGVKKSRRGVKDLDSSSGSATYWLCVLGQVKFWDTSYKYVRTIQLDVGSSVANKDKLL